MRSLLVLLSAAAALVAAACEGQFDDRLAPGRASAPLIGGTVDAEDPAVVAMAFGGNPDQAFCTGTLVSPSVVLTAAHCVDMLGDDPVATVFFGSDTRGDGIRIGLADKQQHLTWNGNVEAGYDVAVVKLNSPVDPFLAMPLNTTTIDESYVDAPYRHVGFGVYDRATQTADGKKRTGTTTINALVAPSIIQSGDDLVSVCFGDSGGPGLVTIDDVEYVAGIHSYTNGTQCNPPNGDTRVDAYVADFIAPYIAANDPACGANGTCAPIGCEADPDCEPCGRDGACTDGCALPDPDCPTSGLGEICQADSQCESDLCVFWRDDLHYRFCSEPCELGGASCPDGMSCQTVTPFGAICYYDEPPAGVLGDACEDPLECGSYRCDDGSCAYACDLSKDLLCPPDYDCEAAASGDDYVCRARPVDGGGCGCRAGADGTGGALAFAALALLFSRRRHRRATAACAPGARPR